jgi:hypothetical protein
MDAERSFTVIGLQAFIIEFYVRFRLKIKKQAKVQQANVEMVPETSGFPKADQLD